MNALLILTLWAVAILALLSFGCLLESAFRDDPDLSTVRGEDE